MMRATFTRGAAGRRYQGWVLRKQTPRRQVVIGLLEGAGLPLR